VTFEPNPGNNVGMVSCYVLDSTHIGIVCRSLDLPYYAVMEVASVNLVRLLSVGLLATETLDNVTNYKLDLLIQTGGKSVIIVNDGSATGVTNLVRAKPFTMYYKGLTTYADTPPTPCYGFLGVALEAINDAAAGDIGLKGTFTGYASGLNVLKKYVRGTNEYTYLKTVNKDYPYGEVLANVMSPTAIEIMIPPGSSVDTAAYWGFEYQPSLSGNGPWLSLTVAAVDTFTAWTQYLVPGSIDRFVEGMSLLASPMNTADEYLDVVQIGYGLTTVNVTLLVSIPVGFESLSAVGLYPALLFTTSRLRVPSGQNVYIRHCRYDGDITTENIKVALTLSQLE
jgi:hypothetical protein